MTALINLPPVPTFSDPVLVDPKKKPGEIGFSRFNPIWLKWFLDAVAYIQSVAGGNIQHDALQGLQGGSANQMYHLTSAEYTGAGSGIFVRQTAPTLNQAALVGVTDGSSATAGNVGEVISGLVASGSPVGLTNNTAANIVTLSLSKGAWMVGGNVNFAGTVATVTAGTGGVSTTSATLPTDGSEVYDGTVTTLLSDTSSITFPTKLINLAAAASVYLVAKKTFSAGTVGAFGAGYALRIR